MNSHTFAREKAFAREKEMIDTPTRWPLMRLPLKRWVDGQSWPQLGFLTCGMEWAGPAREVHLGTVFDDPGSMETILYASTDLLLADGWFVD
jgi:hypothetical protein